MWRFILLFLTRKPYSKERPCLWSGAKWSPVPFLESLFPRFPTHLQKPDGQYWVDLGGKSLPLTSLWVSCIPTDTLATSCEEFHKWTHCMCGTHRGGLKNKWPKFTLELVLPSMPHWEIWGIVMGWGQAWITQQKQHVATVRRRSTVFYRRTLDFFCGYSVGDKELTLKWACWIYSQYSTP